MEVTPVHDHAMELIFDRLNQSGNLTTEGATE